MPKVDFKKKLTRLGCLTVRELIDELSNYPDDSLVVFEDDYGDRGNTLQALPVSSVDELDQYGERLEKTAYSASGIAIADVDYDSEEEYGEEASDEEAFVDVVILRR